MYSPFKGVGPRMASTSSFRFYSFRCNSYYIVKDFFFLIGPEILKRSTDGTLCFPVSIRWEREKEKTLSEDQGIVE